jgi:DNA-binding NarL/FixJ family response regulator
VAFKDSRVRPRILLADDHTLMLEGIRLMLEPEFELVGSVEDGQALLMAARKLTPDVIHGRKSRRFCISQ